MIPFFLFLVFTISEVPDDYMIFVSSVDMNSATHLCSEFPTMGYIYSSSKIVDVNWTLPSGCDAIDNYTNLYSDFNAQESDNYSNSFIFSCSQIKIYELNVSASNEAGSTLSHSFQLSFKKCSDIHWYAYVKNSEHTGRSITNGSELLIWPVSSLQSSMDENSHTAKIPNPISMNYALSMNETNDYPQINLRALDGSSINYVWNEKLYFNSELNCWTTTVFFRVMNDFNVRITSKDRYQGNEPTRESFEYFCPTSIDFNRVFTSNYFKGESIQGEYSFDEIPNNLEIIRHPCVRSTALIHSNDLIITTNDDFDSTNVYRIAINITSIILTTDVISWLSDGVAYSMNYKTGKLYQSKLSNVNTFVTVFNCNTLINAEGVVNINNIIVASFIGNNSTKFYFTIDGWKTYQTVNFSKPVDLYDLEIISSGHGRIVFLYKREEMEYTQVFSFWNYMNGTFNGEFEKEISFMDSGLDKANIDESYLVSNNIGQIYVVSSNVYISTDNANTFLPLRMISLSQGVMPSSKIRDIVFSRCCKCAVLYDTGEIYIIYPDQIYFVQIQAYGGSSSYLRFDHLDRICLLNFRQNMSTDYTIKYPILINSEIEVFSILYPNRLNIECPFVEFDVNYPLDGLSYIDKNTEVHTYTTIVSRGTDINPLIRATGEVDVAYSIRTIPGVELNTTSLMYSLMNTVRTDINLTADHEGISYLFVSPNGATYQCGDSPKILNIFVGCPKGRHVRLKNGNVIYLFYSKTRFKPELELYDDDTYIKDVDMNFAVYMINKPKGSKIKYCQTAGSAGCIRKPQTWNYFLDNNIIWNHSNYQSCFEGEPEEFDRNEYYNLMNKSDHSCIVLIPKNREYHFRAVVLDPEFSYCYLSTEFTVIVHGEPMSIIYSVIIIIIVLIVCMSIILCTHIILNAGYKKEKQHEKKKID